MVSARRQALVREREREDGLRWIELEALRLPEYIT